MIEPLVIGLDVSTNAAKALVVDAEGRTLAEGRASYPLSNPAPRAWEQRASDWLDATIRSVAQATSSLSTEQRAAVRAIAIAHQRETFVLVDAAGAPLCDAVVWMDGRASQEVSRSKRELDPGEIARISGKEPCTTPSLYKIRMLLERVRPELAARVTAALDVHAYLTEKLTGRRATSLASADPLGLVDMERRRYSPELCALAGLDARLQPELYEPGMDIAPLRPDVAARCGLGADVRLIAGAGDGQAACLGTGVVDEGTGYLNVGTALVGGTPSARYRTSRAYRTLFAAHGGYLLETDLKGGTLTLDWLADRLLGKGELASSAARYQTLEQLEQAALALPPGAAGLMALPYWAGVMNPHWEDDVGGALVGLRADHGPAHLFRAIVEGLAFEQRLAFEAVEAEVGPFATVVATGGAMARPELRALFVDALGRALIPSSTPEATALGAALLCFPALGLAPTIAAAARATLAQHERVVSPGAHAARYSHLFESYRGLYAALAPALRALGEG